MTALAVLLALQIDIRPKADADWGGPPIDNVKKVLDAAAGEMMKHFPGRKLDPILVEPKGGPITLHARGPNGEYQVKLATGGTFWSQYTYQFAHELAHILCGYTPDMHAGKWFEETLCELASLFVLRRSAETWKTTPPYANWKDYAKALAAYADDIVKRHPLPEGKTLAAWVAENADALAKNAEDRRRNSIVAVQLLPLFEKSPERWEAVTWLNAEKLDAKATFAQGLAAWRKRCPERHRAFVGEIAAELGVELPR